MTPTDAAANGASYGAAVAAAAHADDARRQRAGRNAAVKRVPCALRAAWWNAHDAAYRATWARLSGGEDVSPQEWYERGRARRREEEANDANQSG